MSQAVLPTSPSCLCPPPSYCPPSLSLCRPPPLHRKSLVGKSSVVPDLKPAGHACLPAVSACYVQLPPRLLSTEAELALSPDRPPLRLRFSLQRGKSTRTPKEAPQPTSHTARSFRFFPPRDVCCEHNAGAAAPCPDRGEERGGKSLVKSCKWRSRCPCPVRPQLRMVEKVENGGEGRIRMGGRSGGHEKRVRDHSACPTFYSRQHMPCLPGGLAACAVCTSSSHEGRGGDQDNILHTIQSLAGDRAAAHRSGQPLPSPLRARGPLFS